MSSRIILHLRRLSVAVLAEGVGSTACPSPHGSAQLDLTALRSVPSATRRPGAAGRCGAAQGRTLAVSACSTRAIRPVLSRQSALPLGAQQCQLDNTACDRHGARRVGRAVQGGRAERCWVPACGGGPPPRARNSLPRLHLRLELRRHPWHSGTSLLGKTSDRRDAQRPWSAFLIATGPLRRPRPLGRHAAARSRSARARGRAVGIFAGGDKTRMITRVPPEAESGAQMAFLPLRP